LNGWRVQRSTVCAGTVVKDGEGVDNEISTGVLVGADERVDSTAGVYDPLSVLALTSVVKDGVDSEISTGVLVRAEERLG
jgi:hypothetical protein